MKARTPIDYSKPLPNVRHEAFCQAYVKLSGNATEAYKVSHPYARQWRKANAAESKASALLAKVRQRIDNIRAAIAASEVMDRAEACRLLTRQARADGSPRDSREAVMSLAKLLGWEAAQAIDLTTGGQPLTTRILFEHAPSE